VERSGLGMGVVEIELEMMDAREGACDCFHAEIVRGPIGLLALVLAGLGGSFFNTNLVLF